MHLKDAINPGISTGYRFLGLQAARWAGATLDELEKWDRGEYSGKFMSTVIAFYNMSNLVTSHVEDARARYMDRKNRT